MVSWYSFCEIFLPFLGASIVKVSLGFKVILEHKIAVLPSETSKISPGNPQYSPGPWLIGISKVYQAVTITSLGISILDAKEFSPSLLVLVESFSVVSPFSFSAVLLPLCPGLILPNIDLMVVSSCLTAVAL